MSQYVADINVEIIGPESHYFLQLTMLRHVTCLRLNLEAQIGSNHMLASAIY